MSAAPDPGAGKSEAPSEASAIAEPSLPPAAPLRPKMSALARAVGWVGAQVIYLLLWLFGRTHQRAELGWLDGPFGGDVIGEAPYREAAAAEGLTLDRNPADGGLLPCFAALDGEGFDARQVHPLIRDFYEHTTAFSMDAWSKTYFPANVALALLVTTLSRQVDQLNFPLSPLDASRGVSSEIILLRRPDGSVRYSGWLRKLTEAGGLARVMYTGFYLAERVPGEAAPCVKVLFPMPRGNATVLLRPRVGEGGELFLDTRGKRFGGAGFYRVQQRDERRVRVWRISTLREHFRLFVDGDGVLRCDHSIRFLGLPVLALHYKLTRRAAASAPARAPALAPATS